MTKAINWPAKYLEEVNTENTTDIHTAFRLGTIYHDHCYYLPDETVDIRVNHKIVRQGVIQGAMKLCTIADLNDTDFAGQKNGIKSVEQTINYLYETYNQKVSPDDIITVIYYKNLNMGKAEEIVDDPHMK